MLTPDEVMRFKKIEAQIAKAIDGGTSLTVYDLTPEAAELVRRHDCQFGTETVHDPDTE